jgi:hypothetical protein
VLSCEYREEAPRNESICDGKHLNIGLTSPHDPTTPSLQGAGNFYLIVSSPNLFSPNFFNYTNSFEFFDHLNFFSLSYIILHCQILLLYIYIFYIYYIFSISLSLYYIYITLSNASFYIITYILYPTSSTYHDPSDSSASTSSSLCAAIRNLHLPTGCFARLHLHSFGFERLSQTAFLPSRHPSHLIPNSNKFAKNLRHIGSTRQQ